MIQHFSCDTHVPVPLNDWVREHNITMFLLPAHASNMLQPFDVDAFGPFETSYQAECHKFRHAGIFPLSTRMDTDEEESSNNVDTKTLTQTMMT